MVVFVVGGVTHSEMRAVHKLAAATGRDIILGSTCVDAPAAFVARLQVALSPCSCHGILLVLVPDMLDCMESEMDAIMIHLWRSTCEDMRW